MAEEYDYEKTKAPDFFGDTLSDGMRVHSVAAWETASIFSGSLASSTRDLAAYIDIERKKVWKQARLQALQECRDIAEKKASKEKNIVESEALKNSAMFGDNGVNKERRKSTMDYHGGKHDGLLYMSREINELIQAEGEE